jgi:hypothetical protein
VPRVSSSLRAGGPLLLGWVVACSCKAPNESHTLAAAGSTAAPSATIVPRVQPAAGSATPSVAALERVREFLARSSALEVLLLDGEQAELSNREGPERLMIRTSNTNSVSVPVRRRLRVTDTQRLNAVRESISEALVPDATAGWCFQPAYAVRGEVSGEKFTLALSARCARAQGEGPQGPFQLGLTPGAERALGELFAR